MDTYGNLGEVETALRDLLAEFADDYDTAALAGEVATYTGDRYAIDLDAAEIMQIADAEYRIEPYCESDAGEDLHRAILDHAARVQSISATPLTVDGVEVRINGEFQAGGLTEWPTAESFWVELTASDGTATVWRGGELDRWGDLLDAIHAVREQADARAKRVERADRAALASASANLADAEAAAGEAREVRDAAIRSAVEHGMTMYRAAQVAGLSQPQVKRIATRYGTQK